MFRSPAAHRDPEVRSQELNPRLLLPEPSLLAPRAGGNRKLELGVKAGARVLDSRGDADILTRFLSAQVLDRRDFITVVRNGLIQSTMRGVEVGLGEARRWTDARSWLPSPAHKVGACGTLAMGRQGATNT